MATKTLATKLTIANILTAGGVAFAVGLVAVGGLTSYTLHQVGVGGAAYERIVAGKDLLGDILPPPEYVIEPYLEANLIYNGQGSVAEHKARLASLRKDFDDRRAYWRASVLPDDLKHAIVDTAGAQADAIWQELDQSFLPAASAGDKAKLAQSFARLNTHYLAHRAVIDAAVTKSNEFVDTTEADVAARIRAAFWQSQAMFGLLILGIVAGFVALARKIARPVAAVADALGALGAQTAHVAEATDAQTKLDANLTALRGTLEQRGVPRVVGDKLYFGDYLVNGETAIVDDVRRRFGGAATIFLGDLRVATNVADPDGKRAIGTRLATGPVRERLFRDVATYQGETAVLGQPFVAIYEPILIDDKAVGALFVGVPFAPQHAAARSCVDVPRNEVARIVGALDVVRQALERRNGIEHAAIDARYRATDEARRAAARVAAAAQAQRLVVGHLTEALQKLAENDLTHRILADFPAEYRSLRINYDRAAATLTQTIGVVVAQARAIFELSAQISGAADTLSQRSEQQAANLEESAAALSQITLGSKRAAEGAAHGRSVVVAADADAARSVGVVDEAVAAMREIAGSANRIAEIVGLIDEIAFQTNLLALNAGVEAARAGDAGRGFAVVAAEVRALALRSAAAAKDIRGLIEASSQGVGRGVALVTRTGEALKRIVGQVGQLSGIVADLAKGSNEQAAGLAEVNAAVNQIDSLTQANSEVARRSSEAAQSLEQEAERLNAAAAQFRIAQSPPRSRAA